jgi:hypothetical protein
MVFELSIQSMPLALQTKCNGIRIVVSVDAACLQTECNGIRIVVSVDAACLQTECNSIRIVVSVDVACFRNGVAPLCVVLSKVTKPTTMRRPEKPAVRYSIVSNA